MSNLCISCDTNLGPPFGTLLYVCLSEFFGAIGLEVSPEPTSVTGPSGTTDYSKYTVVIPNGDNSINLLTIDSARIANSLQYVGYKLPNGSIQGYLNDILNKASNTVATNAGDALVTTLSVIMLVIFILFTLTFIILMCYGLVTPGMGVAVILIGLMITVIGFIVIAYEIYKSVINAGTDLESQGSDFLNTIKCALTGGICCYSNSDPNVCCCPDQGSSNLCANPSCQGSPCDP